MVNRLNHSTNILTASGTSSCSEYIENCYQRRCNSTCCGEFVNDRYYTILRKVCHKIFKDYNRSQCREKYTIFDGGNSINVRIHRSGSRGDQNLLHEQASKEDRYGLQNKCNKVIGQYNIRNKQSNRKSKRNTKKIDFDTDLSNRLKNTERDKQFKDDELNSDKIKKTKSKKKAGREEAKDDHSFDNRVQKSKNTKRDGGEDSAHDQQYSEKTVKRKRKFNQAIDRKGNDGELKDDDKIGNRRSKNKKRNFENIYNKNGEHLNNNRRDLRNGNEIDNNGNEKRVREKFIKHGSKKDENKKKLNKVQEDINAEMTKKNKKVKNKYNEYIDGEDIASDDENYSGKKISRIGKKSKRKQDDIHNVDITGKNGNRRNTRKSENYSKNDETTKTSNSRTKKYMNSQDFDNTNNDKFKSKEKTDRVINNLRKKVRRGEKFGLYDMTRLNKISKLEKLMHQKVESLYYTQSKPSRADEVKACDYLRAHMEARELCRLCYLPQTSQLRAHIYIPKTCVPSCCPNAITSCFSESCKC